MLRATSKNSNLAKMNPLWATKCNLSEHEVAEIVQTNTKKPADQLEQLGDGSDFFVF